MMSVFLGCSKKFSNLANLRDPRDLSVIMTMPSEHVTGVTSLLGVSHQAASSDTWSADMLFVPVTIKAPYLFIETSRRKRGPLQPDARNQPHTACRDDSASSPSNT